MRRRHRIGAKTQLPGRSAVRPRPGHDLRNAGNRNPGGFFVRARKGRRAGRPGLLGPQGPDSGRTAEVQIAIDHKLAGRCQFRICGRSKGSQRNAGRRYGQKSFVQLIDPF